MTEKKDDGNEKPTWWGSNKDLPEGRTSRRRFLVTSVSSIVVVVMIVYFLLTSAGFAQQFVQPIGVSDVGGFNLQIDEATGQGIYIYPGAGDSSNCPDTRAGSPPSPDPQVGEDVLPQIYLELLDAQIPQDAELSFTKDVAVPDTIPGIAGFRIKITRDQSNVSTPLTIGDATVGFTDVTADEISLSGGSTGGFNLDLLIDDRYRGEGSSKQIFGQYLVGGDRPRFGSSRFSTNADPGSQFVVDGSFAGTLQVQNANANAHFLRFSALNDLREFELSIEYIENDFNLNIAEGSCPVVGPGLFVTIDDIQDSGVGPGDTLDVVTTIENPGAQSTSGTVTATMRDNNGNIIWQDSQSVSRNAAGVGQVTFSDTVDSTAPPDFYDVTVDTPDDSATGTAAIGDPPFYDVSGVQVTNNNNEVIEGNALSVTANVTNTGDITGDQNVVLNILDDAGASTVVDEADSDPNAQIDGGVSRNYDGTDQPPFTWQTSSGDSGTYTAEVSTDNDGQISSTFTVLANDPSFQVSIQDTNTGGPNGNQASEVYEGEIANVTVTVDNTGVQSGTQDVVFETINSSDNIVERDRRSVSLAADDGSAGGPDETTIDLEWATTDGDSQDNYAYIVSTQNDSSNTGTGTKDQTILAPDLRVTNVQTNSPVPVGSYNSNGITTDITVENTAGPNAAQSLTDTLRLDIDRNQDATYTNDVDNTSVTVGPNSQNTYTLSPPTGAQEGDEPAIDLRGTLDSFPRNSPADEATVNVQTPFYEVTVQSVTAASSGGDPQIGNTNPGTDTETINVDVSITNTGNACGQDSTDADIVVYDTSSSTQLSSNDDGGTPFSLCPGQTETRTVSASGWDSSNNLNAENAPHSLEARVSLGFGFNTAYYTTQGVSPNAEAFGTTHPEDFSYTLNSADSSIQAGSCGDCTFNVNFDITNNMFVQDTTHVTVDILDQGDGSGPGSSYDADEADVTVGAGSTVSQGLSNGYSCSDFSEDDDSYPFDWNIDQEFSPISNNQMYNVLSGSFTVDAGTSPNWYGSPDPCGS